MATQTIDERTVAQGNAFVWHQLNVPSVEKAIDFYTKGLGFGTKDAPMENMTYHMLTRDGIPIAGVMSTEMQEMKDVPPHWATFLSVDDVDARIETCKKLGAKVEVPAMDVPTVGRMALIADPQGAYLWIFKAERA